ncbi:MAG TPA: DUF2905 domain-containing protein [bacterium]|nr:DUF2905 domain-containing protein [bacterium]HPN42491.1 DUF2905 domain-containing protein [bacterium]
MPNIGKIMVYAGLAIALAGIVVLILNRFGIHLGRLPGDIVYKKGSTTVYFPVVTCIVLSVLVSLLLWLFKK